MGRHKGSRNRSTLVATLVERGVPEQDATALPYEDLSKKVAEVEAAKPKVPDPVERTVVDPEVARTLITATRHKFDAMLDYYAPGKVDKRGNPLEVPERIQDFVRKAFYAKDAPEARDIAHRAVDKFFTHLLMLWSKGKITGPNTPENLESRAKGLESLARMAEKEKKTAEVARLLAAAAVLRSTPPVRLKLFF